MNSRDTERHIHRAQKSEQEDVRQASLLEFLEITFQSFDMTLCSLEV